MPHADDPTREPALPAEWFDLPTASVGGGGHTAEPGLRFQCTLCGNCCSGPPGYVHVNDEEATSLAGLLGVSTADFIDRYCVETAVGRSLKERPSAHGFDCVFLDRDRIPGKAVCSVYEARPEQCRAWPFWPALLRTAQHWSVASCVCPGIGKGPVHAPEHIRLVRATIEGRLDPSR